MRCDRQRHRQGSDKPPNQPRTWQFEALAGQADGRFLVVWCVELAHFVRSRFHVWSAVSQVWVGTRFVRSRQASQARSSVPDWLQSVSANSRQGELQAAVTIASSIKIKYFMLLRLPRQPDPG